MTGVFDAHGHLALIAGTAAGDLAGGIGPGASARRLHRRTRKLMPGVVVGRGKAPTAHYVYGVSGRTVRFVAVATGSDLRSKGALQADLRAAGLI